MKTTRRIAAFLSVGFSLMAPGVVQAATVAVGDSGTVVVSEAVVGSSTLKDGTTGVDIRFQVTNNSTAYIRAFAVGNNSADDTLIRYSGDGEWIGSALLIRDSLDAAWTAVPTDLATLGWTPMIDWVGSALDGYTRAFYFENVRNIWGPEWADVAPGSSIGGTEAVIGQGSGRFQGIAASLNSPFAVLASSDFRDLNADTVFTGTTTHVNTVPLPPAALLFLSGIAGLAGWSRRRKTSS